VAWLNEAFAVQERLTSTNHKTFKAGFQQSPAIFGRNCQYFIRLRLNTL